MKKLTDEQITTISREAWYAAKCGDTIQEVTAKGIRAALALADEPEAQPEPARKPWPKLPAKVGYCGNKSDVCNADDERICDNVTEDVADALALALNMLPRCVAVLRRNFDDFAERQAILAEIDAAGFDLPTREKP